MSATCQPHVRHAAHAWHCQVAPARLPLPKLLASACGTNLAEAYTRSMVQAGTTMQIHEALGMGSSGTVLKATLTQPVAIKRANRQPYRSGTSQRTLEDAEGDRVAQENVDFEARMLAIFKVQTHQSSTLVVPAPVVNILKLVGGNAISDHYWYYWKVGLPILALSGDEEFGTMNGAEPAGATATCS